jgi:hypothetical protein
MRGIAVFYHTLFFSGDPPQLLPSACAIVHEQMQVLTQGGLLGAASQFIVGINGGDESKEYADLLLPPKATRIMHGLQSKSECRTILALEQWLPGHEDWYVCYFHAKGATHPIEEKTPDDIKYSRTRWRGCMMRNVIQNWTRCVSDLNSGFDAAGCHWMAPPFTPFGQHLFGGNFFWAKVSYLRTLPSIMERDRIKIQSGIDSAESRFEAEVWIGNGPRLPSVKDYHGPEWHPGMIRTCHG